MAATKVMIQNSATRCKIKISSATTITSPAAKIFLKLSMTALFAAAGNLTLTAGAAGAATITRTTGTWQADLTTAIGTTVPMSGGVGTTPYGGHLYLDLTAVGAITDTAARKVYTIISISGAVATVAEAITTTQAGVSSASATGYYSDVGGVMQTLGVTASVPEVTINKIAYSVSTAGDMEIKRGAVSIAYLSGMQELSDIPFTEQPTQDIDTTTTTKGGFIVYELVKMQGFITDQNKA